MKQQRQLRIMWQSNHPKSSSGYAQQSQDIIKKLLESGWDSSNLALINMFGQNGWIGKDDWGLTNYPILEHVVGSDAMLHHGNHFKSDIVITLQDVWMLNPQDLSQIRGFIPWTPIDYDPVPKGILNNLRYANRIIAMSKFGQKQLQDNGFSSTYIPHHVDTKIFFPLNKQQRKLEVKIDPNMFIFGMISANKDMLPRKAFGHVLLAFQRFQQKHPQTLLYIHTDPDQPGGYPLRQHVEYLGLQGVVGFPEKYHFKLDTAKEEMNRIYGTFDCLLSPSSTEGFCIPVIEAQATGTPVIVNDYTSMPELIKDGVTGFKTRPSDDCKHFMPIGGYMHFPSVDSLYDKMEEVYRANRPEMGVRARKWVEENYALDKIWKENWLGFLNKVEKEFYPQEEVKK